MVKKLYFPELILAVSYILTDDILESSESVSELFNLKTIDSYDRLLGGGGLPNIGI